VKQKSRRHVAAGRLALALLVSLSVISVAQRPPTPRPGSAARPSSVVWPESPAPAKIRFIRSLTPADVMGRKSVLGKVWNAVTGGGDPPSMIQPYGVSVDATGQLLVADTFGRAIHVLGLTRARYSAIRVDGDSLVGVATTGQSILVTDSASGRLLCLDPKGRRRWVLGPEAGLGRPTGLAVTGDRLYVVDTTNHQVLTVGLGGAILNRFGRQGSGPGEFNLPTNIATMPDGRVVVTDSMNFRVQIFDASGHYLSSFGQLGDGAGDLHRPKGVAVDSDGHIYVVEGVHDVVQVFDESGRFLLAFGESGGGPGQLWLPSGIAIADDFIYVADSSNRRVQVYQYLGGKP
jgi:DNA-binding beta-propeller fold protein YncE